jgi:AcrR family transcriptional regulator
MTSPVLGAETPRLDTPICPYRLAIQPYCPALASVGYVTPRPPSSEGSDKAAQSSAERIRDAALRSFARDGTTTTSLREIATAAGVSIGLVQHHYGTKARLIKAVDDYVLAVLGANLAGTTPGSTPEDPVGAFGHRVVNLITQQPDVVDYVGRMLIDGNQIGSVIFDGLVTMGEARWKRHTEQQLTRTDLDHTWAALNPLILVLGAITLRTHIDRHLPESFTTATQLMRWEGAVSTLIREGQLRSANSEDTSD